MKVAILILASIALLAQTPEDPQIPESLAAKFWRAQAQLLAIMPEFIAKDAAVKAAKAELDAACGPKHVLVDQDGLKCIAKPEPKKDAPPK